MRESFQIRRSRLIPSAMTASQSRPRWSPSSSGTILTHQFAVNGLISTTNVITSLLSFTVYVMSRLHVPLEIDEVTFSNDPCVPSYFNHRLPPSQSGQLLQLSLRQRMLKRARTPTTGTETVKSRVNGSKNNQKVVEEAMKILSSGTRLSLAMKNFPTYERRRTCVE